MSSLDKNGISKGQRIWAAILVLVTISRLVMGRPPASILSACGFLLFAWSLMYYPAPGFRSSVGDIYRSARRGSWFTPKYVRLVMLLAVILMIVGSIYPLIH